MIQFSIIIPLYNKNDFIVKALESIKNQTYKHYEVLIINDGSTDQSESTVRHWLDSQNEALPQFRLLSQTNRGVSTTRNRGVTEAKHPYVAFLDADDYWKENHLYNLMLLIEKYSDDVDLFSNGITFQMDQKDIDPDLGDKSDFVGILDYFSATMASQGFIITSSACAKKEALLRYPFPVDMKNFEDVITWAKVANNKGMAFSSERTIVHVVDNGEASRSVDFTNYLKFEQHLWTIPCDGNLLNRYIRKIFLFSILAARIQMPYGAYVKQMLVVFGKSKLVTAYTVAASLIPRSVLLFLRSRRKR